MVNYTIYYRILAVDASAVIRQDAFNRIGIYACAGSELHPYATYTRGRSSWHRREDGSLLRGMVSLIGGGVNWLEFLDVLVNRDGAFVPCVRIFRTVVSQGTAGGYSFVFLGVFLVPFRIGGICF